jgi:hypothetical protein
MGSNHLLADDAGNGIAARAAGPSAVAAGTPAAYADVDGGGSSGAR